MRPVEAIGIRLLTLGASRLVCQTGALVWSVAPRQRGADPPQPFAVTARPNQWVAEVGDSVDDPTDLERLRRWRFHSGG